MKNYFFYFIVISFIWGCNNDSNSQPECKTENYCYLVNGEPTCMEGYDWEDIQNPDNLNCIEIQCDPTTCELENKNCDSIDDGCGTILDCGLCNSPQTCGGSGIDNVCGIPQCDPTTCELENKNCDSIDDGCGTTLNCGPCNSPQTCGGSGISNVCGCTPVSDTVLCSYQNAECGTIVRTDNCGTERTVNCGTCGDFESCGINGNANICSWFNGDWQHTVIDDGGLKVSMVIDTNNIPHLSYTNDTTYGDLKYSYYFIDHYENMVVDTGSFVGEYANIALNNDGTPFIAQRRSGDLYLMEFTGITWSATDIYVGGNHVNIGIDNNNNFHICTAPYNSITGGWLDYYYNTGLVWDNEIIHQSADTSSRVGNYCSIETDSTNVVHIAYINDNFDRVNYAYNGGSGWIIEIVDDTSTTLPPDFSDMALDSTGIPCIAYSLEHTIKYAKKVGNSWVLEEVDNNIGAISVYTSLTLDSTGNAHISYYDSYTGEIKYAKESQSGWQVETVDYVGTGTGGYNDIKLDSNGLVYIAYYNSVLDELHIVSK
jgi:hypothetical protein